VTGARTSADSTAATTTAAGRTPPPGAIPPAGPPPDAASGASSEPSGDAPGLREQVGRTKSSGVRLVRAHVDLAKAELGEIVDNAKRLALYLGIAIALVLFAGMLASIGSILWIGEWWFGSIGWGVLLGTELFVAAAVSLVMIGLGTGAAGQVRAVLVAVVVAVVIAVLLALNLPNRGWSGLADALTLAVRPEWRVLALAVPIAAVVLAVLGLVVGLLTRAGAGGAIGLAILGAIVGAILGGLSAITYAPQVAAALGIAIGLGVWIVLAALAARGISMDELKDRFYPDETIDTTKETIEWVRERTPLGRKS
jgi:Putative Actinobacterial Holin-X, holin superfamily III